MIWNRFTNANNVDYLLFMSTSCSTVNSSPFIGSVLFSLTYFSIRRLSKIDPDTGDTTGCSGTSLETKS